LTANVHASCVVLAAAGQAFGAPADAGILLLGESGAGKSDTALRLVECGARLVSDDRTELFIENGRLAARAAKTLEGLFEIRGVGIVELPRLAWARVDLAIELVAPEEVPRLPEAAWYALPSALRNVPELRIPLLRLSLTPSIPAKIAAAAALLARSGPKIASQIP
jgi:serine kinase of HPr protein (carbohydrate metabolism regulator)